MKTLDRRDFLKMAGAGSVVAVAGAMVPISGFFAWSNKNVLRFRAVAGMPKAPWPTYASYVIEGQVDVRARTGNLVKSIYAGAPDAMSGIAFPGTVRAVTITNVRQSGNSLLITGQLTEPKALLQGEGPAFSLKIDRSAGVAHADFLGSQVVMKLD